VRGHRPKAIAGKHHTSLSQRIRERDLTLRGLVAELTERGLVVDYRSVWSFVHAEKLSFKNAWWLASATVPTSPPTGAMNQASGTGSSYRPGLHRRDLDQNQHGTAAWMGAM
jgi:putative transposase